MAMFSSDFKILPKKGTAPKAPKDRKDTPKPKPKKK